MKRVRFVMTCLLVGSMCPVNVFAANAAFQQGTALYTKGQYAPAAAAFAQAIKAEPGNSAAYLSEANCLYMLGKRSDAAAWYRAVIQRFPNSPAATSAQSYLAKLEPSAAPSSGSAQASPASASSAAVSSKAASSNDEDPESSAPRKELFRVLRPQGDHPYCTSTFITQVKGALSQCPPNVVEFVKRKGALITITPTMIDRYPETANERPRGYEEGLTGKNVPACCSGKEVVICQFSEHGENGGSWEENDDPIQAVRHEFGHAIDHICSMISASPEFRKIYYFDRGKMDDQQKSDLSYYVQAGKSLEVGPSECFAEACSTIFGGGTSKWRKQQTDKFKVAFPGVIDFVNKKLNSIQ